jgi:hypothetical protein
MIDLHEFKRVGETKVKCYTAPVANLTKYNEWVLGYCMEQMLSKPQKTLSVSRTDKRVFNPDEPFQDLKLKECFGESTIQFTRVFPSRGYTVMYIF